MAQSKIVTATQWRQERQELLKQEKEFTKLRDELTQRRQQLSWVKIEKNYQFTGMEGKKRLSELFGTRSQLIVYHFMFGVDWQEGCKSCSFWADNFNSIIVHLNERDTQLVAISQAPIEKLMSYKARMGWQFEWLSSFASEFNYDFQASSTEQEQEQGKMLYNFHESTFVAEELPGASVFYKDEQGDIFHTYSCYARGLDMMNTAYHFLDLTPKGRDEKDFDYPMQWVKRHDEYDR